MREYSIGTIIDISANLKPEHVTLLTDQGWAQSFKKADVIYRQGESADDVYFLVSGQAKSVLISSAGGECLLRIHLPHSIMGLSALATRAVRDAEAVATADCEAIRMSRAQFLDILQKHPKFASYVTRLLVDRMSDFHHRVGDFLTQNVEQRLATSLLSLSRSDPEEGDSTGRQPIRLTHEELASLLGARRPTITAILNRFVDDGMVAKAGRAIEVADPERLAHLLPRTE